MFGNVYKDRRVLITGHSGFKGSWLSHWLIKLGAEVSGFSLDIPASPSHFKLLNSDVSSNWANILDLEKLSSFIDQAQPEIIFHLAAQPLVRESYAEPLLTFETNIMGTANLLEVVRKHPSVKAVVNITTDKVYENREKEEPYQENDSLGGYDPYSASKAGSEIITASYRRAFFNPAEFSVSHNTLIATARSGNVIGGGDWAKDRLIPDIIAATVQGQKVSIRNPNSTRPWQHVLEPLSGYLLLGKELLVDNVEAAAAWNFGPKTEQNITVGELLVECQKLWTDISFEIETSKNPHEAGLLQLNSAKAKQELGWENVWNYQKSLKNTIEWYQKYYEAGSILTSLQLDSYINDAKEMGMPWIQ